MKRKTILCKTLARALSTKRPHNGVGVEAFTEWLWDNVPAELHQYVWRDGAGNLHVDNRTRPEHRTLFVAHVDTVHREDGANKIRKAKGMWHAVDACLGADDGAGVAILMHMMHNNVAGYYIFTQGEECGGIGAKFIAKYQPELLDQFDRAIAFDRRGTDSIITHQGYGRTASDAFAQALADQLNATNDQLMYSPDNTGVYTDTAEFIDNIPECTNISVGYYSEHGVNERLDIFHYQHLSSAVLAVNWDGLPTERDPKLVESMFDYGKSSTGVYAWPEDDFNMGDYQWEKEDVMWALYDAKLGYVDDLLDLVAESVYPEDPDLALRHLNAKLLTDKLCDEFKEMAKTFDAATVLATVFDALYQE